MIVLQRALERTRLSRRTHAAGLLMSTASTAESHQPITLVFLPASAPDSPRYEEQASEDDGAADADYHADYRVLGLCRHARGLVLALRERCR